MNGFQSFLAPEMASFVKYRTASGKWGENYAVNLKLFDRYCAGRWPTASMLEQPMVDGWWGKRPTESGSSCRKRIYCIRDFVMYLRKNGLSNVNPPQVPDNEKVRFIPHAFTRNELSEFFAACDRLPSGGTWEEKVRAISIPVFFRLLYSSGLRTCEARLLACKDVDLETGVLDVRHAKGHADHRVVLHDTMLSLMRRYNLAVMEFAPGRRYFFPARKDNSHTRRWVEVNFKEIWEGCGFPHAVPYSIRHCYATTNINRWTGQDDEFNSRFVYLSKSMGHSVLESTRYYYSLTPEFSHAMREQCEESFDAIVPEVQDEQQR